MTASKHSLVLCATAFSLVVFGRPDAARAERYHGGGSLNMDLGYDRSPELGEGTIGLSLISGIGKKRPILYMVGIDYRLGFSRPFGAIYDVNFSPIGVGLLAGRRARLSLHGFVGLSGVTRTIPMAGQVSAEARLDIALGDRIRVETVGRLREVFASSEREDGSERAPFADEMTLGVRLRLGRTYRNVIFSSNGYYLGLFYTERFGASSVGFRFGYSLDFSI